MALHRHPPESSAELGHFGLSDGNRWTCSSTIFLLAPPRGLPVDRTKTRYFSPHQPMRQLSHSYEVQSDWFHAAYWCQSACQAHREFSWLALPSFWRDSCGPEAYETAPSGSADADQDPRGEPKTEKPERRKHKNKMASHSLLVMGPDHSLLQTYFNQ